MENGNTLNTNRPELEAAERKNYENYEQETARRLAKAAWQSFEGEGEAKALDTRAAENADRTAETTSENSEVLSLNLFLTKPENISSETPEEISEIGEREEKAITAMRKLIRENLSVAARENSKLEKQESDFGLLLKMAKQEGRGRVSARTEVTDYIRDQIDSVKGSRGKLAEQTPESYTLIHGLELREHIKQVQSGEMVTTPYVTNHLERVENNIAEGRPTFLHGHLGSGKTELAINAAREASIDKVAYEEAMKDIAGYHKANPNASQAENTAELGRAYRRHQAEFKKAFLDGDLAAREKFSPLVISGSKDLTSQDLFTDKSLKLTKFNGKSLLEHKDDLDALIKEWQAKHPEDAKDPEKAKTEADKIIELYKLKNQAFGTEVETIKQAIYRGVEEGRPVVIDEINAIPSAVLISLNDVLQRRPGDNCYIPGAGAVKIQPGFSIIMTGNLSSGRINYMGTEDLNPAFLSRLDIIEHDYLPMSEDGNLENQIDPKKNELFHVVVSYLADRQGNLRLPEMDESLEKLFSLCQLAHKTQNIFGGKVESSIRMDSGEEIEANLEKSVLSIRNILNVLKEWDKGSEKDIDKALWDGFIAGMTNADDQNLILTLAKSYGFFSESNGYNIRVKERGAGFTTFDEIHPGELNFERSPLETYSVRKVVELLYGPGPEREVYPEDIDLGEVMSEVDDEMSVEDLESYENKIAELDKTIAALEVLGEQCGCTVEHNDTEA